MNKKQLTARVQRYMGPGTTQNTASAAVEAVLASILSLSAQEPLHITRFGAFEWKMRVPRSFGSQPTAEQEPVPRFTFHPTRSFPRGNV